MWKYAISAVFGVFLLLSPIVAQQFFRMPDLRAMKHLSASQKADKAPDIPGKETNLDYYVGKDGLIVTVYSYHGNKAAFSTHYNKDIQKTYRIFVDFTGNGMFQEINRGVKWTIPKWARGWR
jgi:uncharacterized protein Usg